MDGTHQRQRARTLALCCALAAGMAAGMAPGIAAADIYSFVDKQGVVHFTNLPRPGRKWKRVMRSGPGKARAVHAPRGRQLPSARYTRYDETIERAAALYHIPEPLIRAVIRVESDYDPEAVSRAGASGLMQLMPPTGRGMGVTDLFDPHQNIFGGTRLLRVLANRFGGDLALTIAAYHAGAGAVIKYGHAVPPYATTQAYVRMVLKRYQRYRRTTLSSARQGPRP